MARKEMKMEIGTGDGGTTCVFLSPTMNLADGPVRVYLGDDLIWFGEPGVTTTEAGWENADRYMSGAEL